jgi:hypothetical protein
MASGRKEFFGSVLPAYGLPAWNPRMGRMLERVPGLLTCSSPVRWKSEVAAQTALISNNADEKAADSDDATFEWSAGCLHSSVGFESKWVEKMIPKLRW